MIITKIQEVKLILIISYIHYCFILHKKLEDTKLMINDSLTIKLE